MSASQNTAQRPSVSAVIPAWNAAETIGRAIDSILAQTWGEAEIVVVDDGSTDGTPQVIARDYPQVKLIVQENAGPSAARNKGAFESSGELIAFLDSDDEWTPDKLQVQVTAMQAHPEIDMLGSNGWRTVGEMRYMAMPPWPRERELMPTTIADIFGERHPEPNTVVIKREVFEALGGFDAEQQRFEDLDLWCRAIDEGHGVWGLDAPTYIAHRRPDSRAGQAPIANRILYGRVATLRKLDPRKHSPHQPGKLAAREHSWLMGRQLALAAFYAMLLDNDREMVSTCLACVDELAAPPPMMRLLRWADRRNEWLLHKLLPPYGKWLNFSALARVCGVPDAYRRLRKAKVVAAALAAQSNANSAGSE